MNFHDRPRALWALPLLVLVAAVIVLGTVLRRPPAATATEVICLALLGAAIIFVLMRFGALAAARIRLYGAWAGVLPTAAIDQIARKPSLQKHKDKTHQETKQDSRVRG